MISQTKNIVIGSESTHERNSTPTDDDGPERRSAHAPSDYDVRDAFERSIGDASSKCECCGDEVDGYDLGDFIVGELRHHDFSDDSHVLLCRECYNEPNWRARVLRSRENDRSGDLLAQLSHLLNRPPERTLFARRAGVAGIGMFVAALISTAMAAVTSGVGPVWSHLGTVSAEPVIGAIATLLVGGYWAHLHEREQNDMRGSTVDEYSLISSPWIDFAATGLGMWGTAAVAAFGEASPTLLAVLVGLYAINGIFAFEKAGTLVRADKCHRRVDWTPRYDGTLFLIRAGVVVGFIGATGVIPSLFAFAGPAAVANYLVLHKWFDLGEDWNLLVDDTGGSEVSR